MVGLDVDIEKIINDEAGDELFKLIVINECKQLTKHQTVLKLSCINQE